MVLASAPVTASSIIEKPSMVQSLNSDTDERPNTPIISTPDEHKSDEVDLNEASILKGKRCFELIDTE